MCLVRHTNGPSNMDHGTLPVYTMGFKLRMIEMSCFSVPLQGKYGISCHLKSWQQIEEFTWAQF